jgi:hypothetical protein
VELVLGYEGRGAVGGHGGEEAGMGDVDGCAPTRAESQTVKALVTTVVTDGHVSDLLPP